MELEQKELENEKKKHHLFKFKTTIKLVVALGVVVFLIVAGIFIKDTIIYNGQTVKLGLEDLGELATQSCTTTEIESTEESRKLFNIKIPLTTSRAIYSYNVKIKAGYDFEKITWEEKNNAIYVQLPKVRVLSKELVMDSMKVYYEKESIFRPITMKEENDGKVDMVKRAEKSAIEGGLFVEAEKNAKRIIKSFFLSNSKYENYDIKFQN